MDRKKNHHILLRIILFELLVLFVGISIILIKGAIDRASDSNNEAETDSDFRFELITESAADEMRHSVPRPDIDEQLLTINEWSRPGDKVKSVDYIVIHYLGNPETTAQENHDYFESLKDLQNISMSANYVIGLSGEIIQCVPDNEVAYASNQANSYSISIENCHPDATGKLKKATYNSLVKLVAYLTDQYDLSREQIIRHYDVTGKDCPKYYVENEAAWERFRDAVMAYRAECDEKAQAEYDARQKKTVKDTGLSEFLEANAAEQKGS